MKSLIIMLVLLGMLLTVSACNMLSGAGKDIEKAGHSMEKAGNK